MKTVGDRLARIQEGLSKKAEGERESLDAGKKAAEELARKRRAVAIAFNDQQDVFKKAVAELSAKLEEADHVLNADIASPKSDPLSSGVFVATLRSQVGNSRITAIFNANFNSHSGIEMVVEKAGGSAKSIGSAEPEELNRNFWIDKLLGLCEDALENR